MFMSPQRVKQTAENSAVASLYTDRAILLIFKPLKMVYVSLLMVSL
jgi:hypothetical protein